MFTSLIKKIVPVILTALSLIFASNVLAFSSDELLIWVGGDKAYGGIRQVGAQFTKDMGINVKVEIPENITDRFQQAAASGSGPDIIFWAHDRYGEWARSGLLAPVSPSAAFRKGVNIIGWDAMTSDGKIYGYPISLEAISLIYNKDILSTPPATFEEMFPLAKKLQQQSVPNKKNEKGIIAIMWDQDQPYFTMPLLAADGGYVFQKTAKGYDVRKTGVNDKGAMEGAKMLVDLIDQGVMPRGVDYSVMEANFNQQKVAMMITGPWAWANLDKNNINYGVAPLPKLHGKPAKAFVGVWGAALNSASPNKSIAQEFLENYLLTEQGLTVMNNDVPLGAVANKAMMAKLMKDPRIAATYQNVEQGLIMPNVPEMGKFWSAMESALRNITSGRQNYREALNNAAKRIIS
ncbi:maltose/maltodextrin ABC transporter substrate-binding protein MalE [Endozoicomonas sp. ONNA2]|uniref:maltose/maltodextrin ABC transporter substrate-binding protein MalE n=1 Tax=Endozoicomonas sp. ONNA2 TaxID=2828741 RepID=UPI00214789DA|nr:maltose/maltodextrin ABC transporter substrate-binding protein MalE [Endozoicomonas sp. ONNA2]